MCAFVLYSSTCIRISLVQYRLILNKHFFRPSRYSFGTTKLVPGFAKIKRRRTRERERETDRQTDTETETERDRDRAAARGKLVGADDNVELKWVSFTPTRVSSPCICSSQDSILESLCYLRERERERKREREQNVSKSSTGLGRVPRVTE